MSIIETTAYSVEKPWYHVEEASMSRISRNVIKNIFIQLEGLFRSIGAITL